MGDVIGIGAGVEVSAMLRDAADAGLDTAVLVGMRDGQIVLRCSDEDMFEALALLTMAQHYITREMQDAAGE